MPASPTPAATWDQPALFGVLGRPRSDAGPIWPRLGAWPTPVESVPGLGRDLFVKRDDRSGVPYGGNKVRVLEALFARAHASGTRRIVATGAYGSNHVLAAVLHGPAAGLAVGALLFWQPHTRCGRENLLAMVKARPNFLTGLPHFTALPLALAAHRALHPGDALMLPGGAVPAGAIAYVSAGLELALQVERGDLPRPTRIVLPAGSGCTTSGLVAGLGLAAQLGIGFGPGRPLPLVQAVRVTPWPVTAPGRLRHLASRTLRLVARRWGKERLGQASLAPLEVIGDQLGRGYAFPTRAGQAALRRGRSAGLQLDTTYSGKAVAHLLRQPGGVTLYWATKSSRRLALAGPAEVATAPVLVRAWLATRLS